MPSHMGECCRWICQEVFRCLLLSGTRGRMVWSSIFTLLKSCCEFLSPWDSPHPFCLYSTTSPAISQLFFVKKIWIFFVRFIQKAREDTLPRSSVSKKSRDFFDTLSDILTCVKMFSTARESGGSPPPFNTIPPLLLRPGPSFSTVWGRRAAERRSLRPQRVEKGS